MSDTRSQIQRRQDIADLQGEGFKLAASIAGPRSLDRAELERNCYERLGFEVRIQSSDRGVNLWKRPKSTGDAA